MYPYRSRALLFIGTALLLTLSACASSRPAAPGFPAAEAVPNVDVGLLVDTTYVDLAAPGGLALYDGDRRLVRLAPGDVLRLNADDAGRLVYTSDGVDTPANSDEVIARADGGVLTIGGTPYRGEAVVRAVAPGRLTAINRLDMETYLLGVVPREIGKVGDELVEAAKAQAVAARTYAVRYLGRRASLGFDVFATVSDQVYGGVEAEHAPVSEAVRATAGEILTYDGAPVEAFYHSTCAGVTASIQDVWPTADPRPYLVAVADIEPATGLAYDRTSNRFTWTQRWDVDQFTGILNRTLADSLATGETVGTLRGLYVRSRTPSGRIRTLDIVTNTRTFTVGGDRIRWIFRTPEDRLLNSSKFDIALRHDAAGQPIEVVAEGGGWGHGIGMCQVGAMGRARAGQDYRTILKAYYTGADISPTYGANLPNLRP